MLRHRVAELRVDDAELRSICGGLAGRRTRGVGISGALLCLEHFLETRHADRDLEQLVHPEGKERHREAHEVQQRHGREYGRGSQLVADAGVDGEGDDGEHDGGGEDHDDDHGEDAGLLADRRGLGCPDFHDLALERRLPTIGLHDPHARQQLVRQLHPGVGQLHLLHLILHDLADDHGRDKEDEEHGAEPAEKAGADGHRKERHGHRDDDGRVEDVDQDRRGDQQLLRVVGSQVVDHA
mmetsp:Transcript_66050/g.190606  ORF Transcript_66050/g.190606 Transcript_66050/m.190606 type:complete len:239 (-) Transcript_66050:645-1361(-)